MPLVLVDDDGKFVRTYERLQVRRTTAAAWTSANPVLLEGEIGFETDTLLVKVGNGTAAWASLPYINQVGTPVVAQDASQITTGTLDAARLPDLSGTYATVASLDSVNSDLQTFKTQVPSNEDLMLTWGPAGVYNSTITGTFDFVVFAAPMPLTINAVSMVWDDSTNYSGTTASDTAYWQVDVWKKGVGAIASRTTQVTGSLANGGITTEVDWNFDAATWSTRDFAKGDVLKFQLSPTGSPGAIGSEFTATIRYQRQAGV